MIANVPNGSDELAQLLLQTGHGDRKAFTALYQRTSSKLFGVCLGMLRERIEAEDALQNVYVAVWRRATRFDRSRAGAMTWLMTVTRNQCIDRLRQHRETPVDAATTSTLVDPAPEPPMCSAASQRRTRLERCLKVLAAQQQSAVRAAFFSGATYHELAQRENVPLATMKSWIRRSLIRLRTCLES